MSTGDWLTLDSPGRFGGEPWRLSGVALRLVRRFLGVRLITVATPVGAGPVAPSELGVVRSSEEG